MNAKLLQGFHDMISLNYMCKMITNYKCKMIISFPNRC